MSTAEILFLRIRAPRLAKISVHRNDHEDSAGSHAAESVPVMQPSLLPFGNESRIAIHRQPHGDGQCHARLYKQPTIRVTDFLSAVDRRIMNQIRRFRIFGRRTVNTLPPVSDVTDASPAACDRKVIHKLFQPIPLLSQVVRSMLAGVRDIRRLQHGAVKQSDSAEDSVKDVVARLAIVDCHTKGLAKKVTIAGQQLHAVAGMAGRFENRNLMRQVQQQDQAIREMQHMLRLLMNNQTVASQDPDPEWITSPSVHSDGMTFGRIGNINDRNYVFSSVPFDLDSRMVLQITDLDRRFMESLTFGVTKLPPNSISIQSLPAFGVKLRNYSANWFVATDIAPMPVVGHSVALKRTRTGIMIRDGVNEDQMIELEDPAIRVYPFFLFDACVKSARIC